MSLRDVFVANVRFYRKKSRLSQQELAERCSIATNYLSEIERGQKFPSVEMIERLSAELDVPAYLFFMGGTERVDEAAVTQKSNSEFGERLLSEVSRLLGEYGFLQR